MAEASAGAREATMCGAVDVMSGDVRAVDGAAANTPNAGQTLAEAASGSSTYATGGGGVSLAHRISTIYLASMLTGERRTEASELPVCRVSFQTGPDHPIDDILLECSDGTINATLAVACRATPNFVQSHKETVKLVGSLLDEIAKFESDNHHVAVAVASWCNQWQHLSTVCDIARSSADAAAFKASLDVNKRWLKQVRDRLDQFLQMVNLATNESKPEAEVLQLAFRLLSRLHLVGFKVQIPDESDRTAVATALDPFAVAGADGIAIRNRLEVEATRYDATGAVVDLNLLRRDLHSLLKAAATRNRRVWDALAEHRKVAAASVRATIGAETTFTKPLEIAFADRRDSLIAAIRKAGTETAGLIVFGESGTGKSALTLSAIAQLEADDPTEFEALVLNFRALPQTSMEFRAAVGASMESILAELSAASRVLVIDAADSAFERSTSLLIDFVLAAEQAGVGVIAVTSDTAQEFVTEQVTRGFDKSISSFAMEPLGNGDIEAISERFPLLRTILRELPPVSLLRRLVVLDLLARTGIELKGSLNEWDCLNLIWSKVVRGEGNSGGGSAEAREQTLLSIAAATLNLPTDRQPVIALDPTAVDALRRDHLIAPASLYLSRPEFAHDEVRRYATAILLVRARSLTATLRVAGGPRWALSAATLACRGQLLAPGASAPQIFARMVQEFTSFASQYGPRWTDLPVEAVLDTPNAYDCLKSALDNESSPVSLDGVVRILEQRHRTNGLPDPLISTSVVQILLDRPEPWQASKSSFEFFAGWLQSLILAKSPAGNQFRIRLRDRLMTFWKSFLPHEPAENDSADDWVADPGVGSRRSRRKELPYEVRNANFIECLALLGPDINDQVEQCLLAVADGAPAFLAPAADSPVSARAIASHNPELLAKLMEAYYIDDEYTGWQLEDGVRDHQGRWKGFLPPFSEYYFGGFWALFNSGSYKISVRVLNNILNHAARVRVGALADLRVDSFNVTSELEGEEKRETGAELNLDGTSRLYMGDSAVWSWYRGTSVGPYAGMSALLAMERVVEGWIDAGIPPSRVVNVLLADCENLAVPGMLFGLLTRHIDEVTDELDAFLAEPMVWSLEFDRATGEYSGIRARTDDLKHQERRTWSPHEVCMTLVMRGNEERLQALKAVGELLVTNGDRLGVSQERTRNWSASLDINQYELTQQDDQIFLQVNPPKELEAAQAQFAIDQEQVNTGMRLQNRYWGSAKNGADYAEPTSAEIALDLTAARELLEADNGSVPTRPLNAVAQVVRVAVQRAAAGDSEALGSETDFVAKFVLELALAFRSSDDQRDEGQYFDLGADRSVAHALPAFLTPALACLLPPLGFATTEVGVAGMAIARKAPLETRLYLARGCDIIWDTPCHGDPCIHKTAVGWLIETANGAELGTWEVRAQHRSRIYVEGDIAKRLQELDGTSIDTSMLDAPIRGLGAAAATSHCFGAEAVRLLALFLDVQCRALVSHEGKGRSADHRGTHALVAARALLDNYAAHRAARPVFDHLDALSANASLLSGFLHGLAAAGAENNDRAQAARDLWPSVIEHALTYAGQNSDPYRDRDWGVWAAAALLPDPLSWTRGLYNELSGPPIEWVVAEDLLGSIGKWISLGRGETKCIDALIRILRKLPLVDQVTRGLAWVTDLCTQDGEVLVNQSILSNDWLQGIRSTAEEVDALGEWQKLVDAMVVSGNEGLAPFSR